MHNHLQHRVDEQQGVFGKAWSERELMIAREPQGAVLGKWERLIWGSLNAGAVFVQDLADRAIWKHPLHGDFFTKASATCAYISAQNALPPTYDIGDEASFPQCIPDPTRVADVQSRLDEHNKTMDDHLRAWKR
jgi:hypothetical protein